MYLKLDPNETALLTEENFHEQLGQIAQSRTKQQTDGILLSHPWDLIEHNPQQLRNDFLEHAEPDSNSLVETNVSILGSEANVQIGPRVKIDPFVVLDTRSGPISIDADVHLQSFTKIEGPCHIGEASQLFRALVREGTTIGPHCRVGGEIEASIIHGYANKYHDGFLGHAYVCPWVNLGALTTNSDLKNDYSNVRIPIAGEMVDTGQMKVGCFIGDHTKTGLGSLFNTGSAVGVMALILPGGELLPKYIPSFSRVWHGELFDGWSLEKLMETARVAMARRDQELTPATEKLLRYLAKLTQTRRGMAIRRYQEKKQAKLEADSQMIHWK